MNNVVLTLGGVAFQDMEVPEQISFGGRQRVAVQNLIGGGRVVSALGLDDGVISFSGIFSGEDAVARAQALDAARALGAQLPLLWDGFYYLVVIAAFTAAYHKPTLIPFSINCLVVSDPLANAANTVAPLANLIEGDIAAASALSEQAGVSPQGLVAASTAGLSAVSTVLTSGINGVGASLGGAAAALNGTAAPDLGVAALGQVRTAASQLAGLAAMQGYVGRALRNLGGALL